MVSHTSVCRQVSVYVDSLSHICTEHYIITSVYVDSFSHTSALNITSLQVCM